MPALNNRILIDLFTHLADQREDMNKFSEAFDSKEDHIKWILSYGNFKNKETAVKWIDMFGVPDEDYYIFEVYKKK